MSKQKFQIGDKVYVKRGAKDEIGRVGNITNIRKYGRRLGYIVKYNDNIFPKSGVFYADMLLFSDMHSLVNHMAKEYAVENDNTKCKYCGTPFNEIPESKSESGVCEYCIEISIAEMSHIPGIGGRILHMKLVDGKKIREIADELSMNESTVKNYLYRGKENLKRILSINHKDLVDTYVDMNGALDLC